MSDIKNDYDEYKDPFRAMVSDPNSLKNFFDRLESVNYDIKGIVKLIDFFCYRVNKYISSQKDLEKISNLTEDKGYVLINLFSDPDLEKFTNLLRSHYDLKDIIFCDLDGFMEDMYSLSSKYLNIQTNTLLKNSIYCFKHEKYDICCVSLFSIIDQLLETFYNDVFYKDEFKLKKKPGDLKKMTYILMFCEKLPLYREEILILKSLLWFYKRAYCPTKLLDENDKINYINRHSMIHGKNIKNITEEDCLKLFSALYALLKFHNIWVSEQYNDNVRIKFLRVAPEYIPLDKED